MSTLHRVFALILALLFVAPPTAVFAQDGTPNAFILAGTCDAFDHANGEYLIGPFTLSEDPAADWLANGNLGTPPGELYLAVATAPLSTAAILEKPHALVVVNGNDAKGLVLSCAPISGPADGNGHITLPMTFEIPGVEGKAILSPADANTTQVSFALWIVGAVAQPTSAPQPTVGPADISGIPQSMPAFTQQSDATATPAAAPAGYTGPVLGDPNAPVTFVVYADFQCPYCGMFHSGPLQELIRDFVVTGQVKVEFREFPFLGGQDLASPTNESVQAAEAAMCAAEQGEYMAYADGLYSHQMGENGGGFADDRLIAIATDLGLDVDGFTTCLSEGRYQADVLRSLDQGVTDGVQGTPSFLLIVNGEQTLVMMTQGGYSVLKDQIQQAIDAVP